MDDVTQWRVETMDSPVGRLLLVTDDAERLRAVDWATHEDRLRRRLDRHYGKGATALAAATTPTTCAAALARYFAGDLTALGRIRVETRGTAFQRAVWAALRDIPCGTTVSYGEIARRIDRPVAVRAVGLANNANPIAIVVPCHRVVGADGSLTGYGGGLANKRWLLAHESASRPPRPTHRDTTSAARDGSPCPAAATKLPGCP